MIVYSFDALTRQFNGVTEAFESPLEPGVFHFPANTTDISPPKFDGETQVCEFVNGAWKVRVKTEAELPVDPTDEEIRDALASDLCKARSVALDETDWFVSRHQDEMLLSGKTTLTSDQLHELLVYRDALRKITAAEGFPHIDVPVAPDFIGAK